MENCSPNELIEEFDKEVIKRCNTIRMNSENTANNMKNAFELILSSIPESIRKMPIKILVKKYDGDIQKAITHLSHTSSTPHKSRNPRTPKSVKSTKSIHATPATPSLAQILKQKAEQENRLLANKSQKRTHLQTPTRARPTTKNITSTPKSRTFTPTKTKRPQKQVR